MQLNLWFDFPFGHVLQRCIVAYSYVQSNLYIIFIYCFFQKYELGWWID